MNAPDVQQLYKAVRMVFGANLSRLMASEHARIKELNSNQKVAAKVGISSNTVGRIRRGENSIGLDMVARMASLYDVNEWELLCPNFDPENRPVLVTNPAEIQLVQLFRSKPKAP